MANLTLEAQSPLNGYSAQFANTSVRELTTLSILSVAQPLNAAGELTSAMLASHDAAWPEPGRVIVSGKDASTWLGLSQDQCFAVFSDLTEDAFTTISEYLSRVAYITDQSDSWVCLEIEGELARLALERICPIDLHPDVFKVNSVTRTSMEYLAVIVHSTNENTFRLFSPSSSARTFLHAVETSFHNIS